MGRILPISQPIAGALARRRARRDPDSPLVFHRDGIPVRRWRTAWRTACQAAGVPTRFLHDCRRTAARNLIRASVPERVAMLLTGHKTRAIFDRYNIINEQELLKAGDHLVASLAQHAQATPRGGRARGRDGAGHAAARAAEDVGRRQAGNQPPDDTAVLKPGGRDPRTARPTVGPRRATPTAAATSANLPQKAAHTATGGARGRTRAVEHEREARAGRDRSQTAPQQPKKRRRSLCVAPAHRPLRAR